MATYRPVSGNVGHYTSASALISILKNRALWFSDIECLNDSKEKVFAAELYQQTANAMLAESVPDPDGHRAAFLNRVKFKARTFHDDQYVCCFSKDIDSLGHWIAYCQAMPVCIVFHARQLSDAVQNSIGPHGHGRFWAGDVAYDGEALLERKVHTLLEQFMRSTTVMPSPRCSLENITDKIALELQEAEVAKYKHRAFSREGEYRISIRAPSDGATSWTKSLDDVGTYLDFVPRPSYVRPTVVTQLGAPFLQMVHGVVIGPGPLTEIAKKKTEVLLKSLGYSWEGNPVQVYESTIPFRNW